MGGGVLFKGLRLEETKGKDGTMLVSVCGCVEMGKPTCRHPQTTLGLSQDVRAATGSSWFPFGIAATTRPRLVQVFSNPFIKEPFNGDDPDKRFTKHTQTLTASITVPKISARNLKSSGGVGRQGYMGVDQCSWPQNYHE